MTTSFHLGVLDFHRAASFPRIRTSLTPDQRKYQTIYLPFTSHFFRNKKDRLDGDPDTRMFLR